MGGKRTYFHQQVNEWNFSHNPFLRRTNGPRPPHDRELNPRKVLSFKLLILQENWYINNRKPPLIYITISARFVRNHQIGHTRGRSAWIVIKRIWTLFVLYIRAMFTFRYGVLWNCVFVARNVIAETHRRYWTVLSVTISSLFVQSSARGLVRVVRVGVRLFRTKTNQYFSACAFHTWLQLSTTPIHENGSGDAIADKIHKWIGYHSRTRNPGFPNPIFFNGFILQSDFV